MNLSRLTGVLLIVAGLIVFFLGSSVAMVGEEVIGPFYGLMALGVVAIAVGVYLYYLGKKEQKKGV